MELVDVHAHLNFSDYDADREAVFGRAAEAGIDVINVGTNRKTSESAIALTQNRNNVWATVGLHPTDAAEGFDYDSFLALAKNEKVVAIGECGLDFFRAGRSTFEKQQEVFLAQINLANALGKPLMLHIRNAYREVHEILKAHAQVKGNAHFFTGTWEEAKLFLNLGFTLSFGGVITFTRDYDEVIKNTPLEMILTETDCPFVAPVPYRGRRNEPFYLTEVVKKLAAIKNLTYDEAAAATLANAARIFNLAVA